MLAGLALMSAMIGLLATVSAVALAVPTGIALALYPVVSSLSLLMLAAIGSLRNGPVAEATAMLRQQA